MTERPDTIAAISTAPGEAGIAIVRVSGPDSLTMADGVFRCTPPTPSERPAGAFVHGFIGDADESAQDVDEALLLVFRAPHSYTREDVIELQCHGGRQCAQRVLRAVLAAGARPAGPGEFTRRAFLNGRLDLLQAEAVLDLIRAESAHAASAAVEQLEGGLSRSFSKTYDSLLQVAADLEATLGFPEEEIPEQIGPEACGQLSRVREDLEALLATWDEGHLLREGALVVIAGRPNVGKSTLLNRLVGRDRAIVTETPGTTRDTIEEQIILSGVPVRLVDTAGLRPTDCNIEREGVQRAESSIEQAQLVLYVVDCSVPVEQSDLDRVRSHDQARCVVVLNKRDLGLKAVPGAFPGYASVVCSLLHDKELGAVLAAIGQGLGITSADALPHAVISERHRSIVQSVLNEVNIILDLLHPAADSDLVLVVSHLRAALETLGTATGRVYTRELLDSIFSRFCIGK